MTTDRGKSEEHNKYTVKKDLTNIFVLRTVLSLKFLQIPVVQIEIGWRIKDSRQVDLRHGHQGEVTPYQININRMKEEKISFINFSK